MTPIEAKEKAVDIVQQYNHAINYIYSVKENDLAIQCAIMQVKSNIDCTTEYWEQILKQLEKM